MASGFRFDPPRVKLSAEECWVLARAFGPVETPWSGAGSLGPGRVVEIAERLDLAERIASRAPADRLIREIGAENVEFLRRAHAGCAARALVVEQVCREAAGVAADLGVPVVFLKGAALQLGGWVEPGSRSMSDADVLVPDGAARRFQDALIAAGCRSPEAPEAEHQLQLLSHPTGLGIEVHRFIPGVRLTGGNSATADDLLDRGLCRPAEELPGGSFVPEYSVLMAHALAHGLAQHGLTPDTYPWSRFLADVQDLAAAASEWRDRADAVLPWIERDVAPEEVDAVFDLVGRLGGGEGPSEIAAGDDRPARLLQHLVAGALDEDYVQSMRFASRGRRLSDQPRWRRIAIDGWRTVWLTRSQVDKLYGPSPSALGYWGWRLWRPFDLVGRACRYAWAAGRHRWRRR